MSNSSSQRSLEKFHFPNSRTLWHDSTKRPRSLGCQNCTFLQSCGGLNVGAGTFDCLTYCRCIDYATCDIVCPNKESHYVARSMEVQGIWKFSNVLKAPYLPKPTVPNIVPMIYNSSARTRSPRTSAVALSLYEIINKISGNIRFSTRQEMLEYFILDEDTKIILSGTEIDKCLERWWKLENRESVIEGIRHLGIQLITTPNYSLFNDVPRHDNAYNMKRIALAWSEIQRQDIPCALHINARTDRDWELWLEFLNIHTEIEYVAFEFGTGAASEKRISWYVEKLVELASNIERSLHLLVRGGISEVPSLYRAFEAITVIDTNAFIRTQKRRRAIYRNGKLTWKTYLTSSGQPIDDLLDLNIATMQEYMDEVAPQRGTNSIPVNESSA